MAIRSEMECSKIMCDWKDYELDYFMNIQPVEATVKSQMLADVVTSYITTTAYMSDEQ